MSASERLPVGANALPDGGSSFESGRRADGT